MKIFAKIADTVHAWRGGGDSHASYQDILGFCFSATLDCIEKQGFVLTPGRYVGTVDLDEEDEPFDQAMNRLTRLLTKQQEEAVMLDRKIAENLRRNWIWDLNGSLAH